MSGTLWLRMLMDLEIADKTLDDVQNTVAQNVGGS